MQGDSSMDDEQLIVVDDEPMTEPIPGPSFYGQEEQPRVEPKTIAESVIRSSRRRGTSTATAVDDDFERSFRPSRSSRSGRNRAGGAQPKLKLKFAEKSGSHAPGMSFLGQYDRELDSDDEDLTFEEHFILRMPPGEDCDKLRKMVAAREASNDVWFKFKDSRRAVFHVGNSLYSAKLVDLPAIIESQKTLDNKQMFKVADICQMLVVEDKIESEAVVANQKSINIDEYIWPHGITPPLHHVRKRRFRKRINKRTIETVEQEVERLLEEDARASQVKYDILENVNPDLSDSEFVEREEPIDAPTPGMAESDMGDAPTPGGGGEDDDEDSEEGEGDIDEELAAELDLALGDEGDEEDEDDDEDQSDEEEEDEEDDETSQSKRLLNEEIRDLEAAVAKKVQEIGSSANPLIRRRFEDALKKLQVDLEMKVTQREEMDEQLRAQKDGPGRASSEANEDGDDGGDEEDD
ncbi:hypothetical protein SCHPADRAFT_163694 [Schizopora paradoxa]|uniref:TAFII55 protein conserved region domain-containing protein n=1 Tax=Schizopora paradoxa TaxID=27342 RepID=A0A0H2S0V9_9AGAM|nr:hypothetical protein SCHPADRAFT_163694 [Schizopora paradoxa]